MDIVCPICCDNVAARPNNLEVTCCGHLFHDDCLRKWILSSPTCPHCRHAITKSSITRIYPSVTDSNRNESISQGSISAVCDKECRELRISYKDVDQKLSSVTKALKKAEAEKEKIKHNLNVKTSEAVALKEQLDAAKQISIQYDVLKKQNEKMSKNLEALTNFRHIFNATSAEVDDMLENCSDALDVRTMATYTAALKRSLYETQIKNKDLSAELQSSKQMIASLKANNEIMLTSRRRLSADVHSLQEELAALKRQSELSTSERLVLHTPANVVTMDSESDDEPCDSYKGSMKYTETSPYLSLQSSNIPFANLQPSTSSTQASSSSQVFDMNWLKAAPVTKVPQYRNLRARTKWPGIPLSDISQNTLKGNSANGTQATNAADHPSRTYDGLGGHAQPETVRPKARLNFPKDRARTALIKKHLK